MKKVLSFFILMLLPMVAAERVEDNTSAKKII